MIILINILFLYIMHPNIHKFININDLFTIFQYFGINFHYFSISFHYFTSFLHYFSLFYIIVTLFITQTSSTRKFLVNVISCTWQPLCMKLRGMASERDILREKVRKQECLKLCILGNDRVFVCGF